MFSGVSCLRWSSQTVWMLSMSFTTLFLCSSHFWVVGVALHIFLSGISGMPLINYAEHLWWMNSGSQQATSLFSRSKTTKKLLASFRGNHQYIQEYHEMLWPGVSVDMIYSKFATFKKRPREEDQVQDAWLREHTISTSVFVSFMVMTMSCKYRNLVDRAAAGTAFQSLVTMMAATLGGFTLDIVPFGSNDNQLTTLCIDQGGFVNASCFWTQAFYAQHARAVWGKDFRNEKKTWITLIHGLGKVHLAHLLSFALDPQHPEPLKGRLETETYNMLSEFANLLDSSVLNLAREIDKLEVVTQLKSKKMRRAIKTIWIETLAKKLWNREDSQPVRYNFVFYYNIF